MSSCSSKVITLDSGESVNISIWDTAGQERFRSIAQNFFKDSQGVIICYDVTNPESLENVPVWVDEKNNKSRNEAVWMLVGCKSDCEPTIDENRLHAIVEQYHTESMTCSAKTGENTLKVFQRLCELIVENQKKSQAAQPEEKKEEPEEYIQIQLTPTTYQKDHTP